MKLDIQTQFSSKVLIVKKKVKIYSDRARSALPKHGYIFQKATFYFMPY